ASAGNEQRVAEDEPGRAGEDDAGQLECAVGDHERIEVRAETAPGQVARGAADERSVPGQDEQAADAEEKAAGKALERDADVVADIEAEHGPVGVGVAATDRAVRVAVHALVLLDRGRVLEREDQARINIGEDADGEERADEGDQGDQHLQAIGAHGGREVDPEQAAQLVDAEVGLAVDPLVATRGERLEAFDQPDRIRARLGDRQVLAGGAIERRDPCPVGRRGSVLARRRRERGVELLPGVGVLRLELQRRHRRPSSQWATPTSAATRSPPMARGTTTGTAISASSSARASVSRVTRPAQATIAACARAVSGTAGARAGAGGGVPRRNSARGAWTTRVPAARSPSRLKSCRNSIES